MEYTTQDIVSIYECISDDPCKQTEIVRWPWTQKTEPSVVDTVTYYNWF